MKPRPAFCRRVLVTAFALTCTFIFGDRAEAQSCNINSIVAGSYGTISNLLTGTNGYRSSAEAQWK